MSRPLKLLVLLTALPAGVTHGYDCSNIPVYSESAAYAEGDFARTDSSAYRCKVSGWCSHGGPYAPGEGWAAGEAWTELGRCGNDSVNPATADAPSTNVPSTGASSNDTPAGIADSGTAAVCAGAERWDSSAGYIEGRHVHHAGKVYKAKWWTRGDSPGQNAGQWQVWSLVSACTESGDRDIASRKRSGTSTTPDGKTRNNQPEG